jgi:hypothetical protein
MFVDYDDSNSRTQDNLFHDVWQNVGLTLGTAVGGWGAKAIAKSGYKNLIMERDAAVMERKAAMGRHVKSQPHGRFFPGSTLRPHPSPFQTNMLHPFDNSKAINAAETKISGAKTKISGKKSIQKFGKNLTSIANVFGWATLAQIGWDIGSSVVYAGSSFKTTKEALARENFNASNDQDTYYDTRAAYTQRQRALQVIHNSRLSLKPMLGNEASYLHY